MPRKKWGIVRLYTLFANYWTGFEREYRKTGSAVADMLAWSLFWYLLHISPLFIGGFIVKKDTHFGTFLYQNRCPDMKKVNYFDTRRLGDMGLLKFCGIGRFCSATKDYSPQRLFFHESIPCPCDSVACFSGFSIELGVSSSR